MAERGDLDWDKELNEYNQFSTRQPASEADSELSPAGSQRKMSKESVRGSHGSPLTTTGRKTVIAEVIHERTVSGMTGSKHESGSEEEVSVNGPPGARTKHSDVSMRVKGDLLWDTDEDEDSTWETLRNERLMQKLTHFPSDSLGFWKGVYKMEQDAEVFNNGVSEQVDHFGDRYVGDRAIFDNYGYFLTHIAPHISGEESPYSKNWAKGFPGSVLHQLQARMVALREQFAETQTLNKEAIKDFMKIQSEIDAYKVVKKEFKHDLKKFLKLEAKEDPARLRKKDFKYREKKNTLELKRFDLYARLQLFNAQRKLRALRPLCKVLRGYYDYFKGGYDLLLPFTEELNHLEGTVATEQSEMEKAKKILKATRRKLREELQDDLVHDQHYHDAVGIRDLDNARGGNAPGTEQDKSMVSEPWMQSTEKEGYLYLDFKPVWVTIRDGLLSVQRPGEGVLSMPLLLCTIKRDQSNKTRHSFSVISPHSSISLQADTGWSMHKWMTILQNAISHQINLPQTRQVSLDEPGRSALAQLSAIGGNGFCADCGSPNPEWLSMNLGILICMNCSGFHRSLGVHISKVRSAKLDTIDDFLLEFMKAIGNTRSNRIWEAALVEGGKPDFSKEVSRSEHERWIRDKYETRQFVARQPGLDRTDLNNLLFAAIEDSDTHSILKYVVWGAELTWVNSDEENRDSLLHAVSFANTVCMELLIQNGAKLNGHDIRDWTCLHYAAFQNDVAATQLLLARGAKNLVHETDKEGRSPLDIAEQTLSQFTGDAEEQRSTALLLLQTLKQVDKETFERASRMTVATHIPSQASMSEPLSPPSSPSTQPSSIAENPNGGSGLRINEAELKAAMKELKEKKKSKGLKKLFGGVFKTKNNTKQLFIPPPRLARELSLVGAV